MIICSNCGQEMTEADKSSHAKRIKCCNFLRGEVQRLRNERETIVLDLLQWVQGRFGLTDHAEHIGAEYIKEKMSV